MMPRRLGLLIAAASLPALAAAGWTDRKEYDLALQVRAEALAAKRLELLERWKSQYPQSALRPMRNEMFLSAYQSMGDNAKTLAAAREILADQPENLVGAYWCALLAPGSAERSPELLGDAEKAARGLLAAKVDDPSWEKQKPGAELMAHRTLGWVSWQKKDYAAAEQEFRKCLEQNPGDARVSAWLGTMLASQPQPEKQVAAIWHLMRAGSLKEGDALTDSQRRLLNPAADRFYTQYHGSEEGLEAVRTAVLAGAFPPADFAIESAASVAARRAEEELAFRNPQLAAWLKIKKRLDAPDGESYFGTSLKGAALPRLKGTVLKGTPARKPAELVLALTDASTEEVTLKLSSALPGETPAGLQIDFEATADSFTPSPFRLLLTTSPDKIDNWPVAGRK